MKQNALHQFSATLTKGYAAPLHRCLWKLTALSAAAWSLRIGTAWLLCCKVPEGQLTLAWLVYAVGWMLLGGGRLLVEVRLRCTLLCCCTERMGIACAERPEILRRLRRLHGGHILLRTVLHLIGIAGICCAGLLLSLAANQPERCVYDLLGAVQVLPLLAVLVLVRIRWSFCFRAADVLAVQQTTRSAWSALRTAHAMLQGQLWLLLRIVLRSVPWLLLPGMLPRCVFTLHLYFSVRCLEWQYEQSERSDAANDRTELHRKHSRADDAGSLSAP